MAGNPNPSPSTRFSSDYQPNPGRKKGAYAKSRFNAAVTKELEDLLGKAHDNIKHALGKKDVRTSMWLIDTVRKSAADRVEAGLLDPLVQAVETFEDIETISHQALLLAIRGDMTFSQLKAVQEALARHSVLKGVVEIGELRRELKQLQDHDLGGDGLGVDHIPSWGKLSVIDGGAEPASGDGGGQ